MGSCAPVSTPMEPNFSFSKLDCPVSEEDKEAMSSVPYRELVGSLMYLMLSSRPDIAYPVGVLSRYVSNPGRKHWEGAKRVLKYLQGTKDYRLTFHGDGQGIKLLGYCDANFNGEEDESKPTSRVLFLMGGPSFR